MTWLLIILIIALPVALLYFFKGEGQEYGKHNSGGDHKGNGPMFFL